MCRVDNCYKKIMSDDSFGSHIFKNYTYDIAIILFDFAKLTAFEHWKRDKSNTLKEDWSDITHKRIIDWPNVSWAPKSWHRWQWIEPCEATLNQQK